MFFLLFFFFFNFFDTFRGYQTQLQTRLSFFLPFFLTQVLISSLPVLYVFLSNLWQWPIWFIVLNRKFKQKQKFLENIIVKRFELWFKLQKQTGAKQISYRESLLQTFIFGMECHVGNLSYLLSSTVRVTITITEENVHL